MPAIATTDVTYAQVGKSELFKRSRRVISDVTFGNGTLTYPSGGVPLLLNKLGFKNSIDSIKIVNASHGDGFLYKPNITDLKIRMYAQGAVLGAAGGETLDDFPVTAAPGVTADLHMSGKAGAATKMWGALKELTTAAGDAPAETTLRLECEGW